MFRRLGLWLYKTAAAASSSERRKPNRKRLDTENDVDDFGEALAPRLGLAFGSSLAWISED